MRIIKKHLDNTCLLMGKGVYPYDYMGSEERLQETKLPSKNLYSKLLLMIEKGVREGISIISKRFEKQKILE